MKKWFKIQAIVTVTVTVATVKAGDSVEAVSIAENTINLAKVAEALVRASPGQCFNVKCEHAFAEEMK